MLILSGKVIVIPNFHFFMLKKLGQRVIYILIHPLVLLLIRFKVSPNVITTIGLIISSVAAVVFLIGAESGAREQLSYVGWGGALILFGGLFDMIDGRLARLGNMSTKFGALYDSVLDRYSELIMFFGITYFLIAHHYFLSSMFAFFALIGSMMVSYTRARAEGLGIDCSMGLMQRPERVVIIGLSALICGIVASFIGGDFSIYSEILHFPIFEAISIFTLPLAVVAILSNITAIRRLNHCRRVLKSQDGKHKKLSLEVEKERLKVS